MSTLDGLVYVADIVVARSQPVPVTVLAGLGALNVLRLFIQGTVFFLQTFILSGQNVSGYTVSRISVHYHCR